jgi:hypothetical protein
VSIPFSPVDLAVSKISRLSDNDRDDIRELVRLGFTTPDEIEQRARASLDGFVGGQAMLLHNLRDAVALARTAVISDAPPSVLSDD